MGFFNQTSQSDPTAFDYQTSEANLAAKQALAKQMLDTPTPTATTVPGSTSREVVALG